MPAIASINKLDVHVTRWMAKHAITFLRVSLGVIFLWFGALKFFPDLSPAEELAGKTFNTMTFGLVSPSAALMILAAWECLIGIALLTNVILRTVLFLLFIQMAGTVAPLLLYPGETFARFPFVPTMEGQYIIKNLVLISAGIAIGATVRGGRLVAEPKKS